ncbi:MAG: Carbon storage regulator [Gammaproteobacteria bacterium]|nr:Carbon storage regulator [Gammaproteobacteria bacterium]
MLVTRSPRQSLFISRAPDTNPLTPVSTLFRRGPWRVRVAEIRAFRVGLDLQVPPQLHVHCDDSGQSILAQCAAEGRSRGVFLLSRHLLESVAITLEAGIPPTTPIARLFRKGPLELHVIDLRGRNVRFGLRAPRMLHIHRRELPERIRMENTPQNAIDVDRSSRAAARAHGLLRDIPGKLLFGSPSPRSMPGSWMKRTPPDL